MKIAKKSRNLIYAAIFLSVSLAVLNIDVVTKKSVNGSLCYLHMPLFVKWVEFIARHYEYNRLAKEITLGLKTDEEKALAVLAWTRANMKDIPAGMPAVEDHILNAIIRGYGNPSQHQDVFITLCTYSGVPAFWYKCQGDDSKIKCALSFAKIGGKWRVFDAYRGIYFRNKIGEIASKEDIINDPAIVSGGAIDTIFIKGVPYRDFYHDLARVKEPETTRVERQMPLKRIVFEAKKILRLEKDEEI